MSLRRRQPTQPTPPPLATAPTSNTNGINATSTSSSTSFFTSQLGGPSVINYSYTDLPLKLVAYDLYQFLRLAWSLPYIVWPVHPADSGPMDELALTWPNIYCMAVHSVLVILQLAFLLGLLPVALFLPVWAAALLILLCLGLNHLLCRLLNGPDIRYHSNPKCASPRPEHAHEQWIFLNGVAVGHHWMQSNLDRLALTFKRPILGVHNKTDGILFDVIECLIQRNFSYATTDVRLCYAILKETLYRSDITKVVFILHSQGGIEGGLVLDWLLQELPQDLLAKLEVYTFGNAANHFNNPHRTMNAQLGESAVSGGTPTATGTATGTGRQRSRGVAPGMAPMLVRETSATEPTSINHRAIGHIEHYAHTLDFVALWGVLHFVSTLRESHTMPRFLGRVFARSSPRGGHQFCQHYLDGMFPLEKDPNSGQFIGCAETGNEFMDSNIQIGREGDESANVHEAYEQSWVAAIRNTVDIDADGVATSNSTEVAVEVEVHSASPIVTRKNSRFDMVKVKDVSRLWQYRNGQSPDDKPAILSRPPTLYDNA